VARRVLSVLALTAALMPGAAMAYELLGPGGVSCGTWTADRRTDARLYQVDQAWVLGFLSGVGYAHEDDLDPLQDLVAAWINNYCQRNPMQEIVDAARAFLTAHPR
jgi:hypothetical protein